MSTEINQVISDGMDKMYAEGFEMAKVRARKVIADRVAWLMKEAHAGGNWEYLKNKADEAAYMGEKIAALTLEPQHPSCSICRRDHGPEIVHECE